MTMKKIFAIMLLLFVMTTMAAQDMIFKRDGSKIDAIIVERNEFDLRYRRINYQDGPLFLVNLADLDSIIYANGDIEVFVLESEIEPPLIKDSKNHYYYHGSRISSKEVVNLMRNNCPDAYSYYKSNLHDEIWGACLTGVGVVMLGFGIGMPRYYSANGMPYGTSGYSLLTTFGSIFTVVGIPLWAIGSINRQNSYNVYNEYCKATELVNFTIQRSENGIGLAMNF